MSTEIKYQELLSSLNSAFKKFQDSLSIITLQFPDNIVDTLKSGQIQKFEMTTELAWKCCKLFIKIKFGDVVTSPKLVYKELFRQEIVDENLYLHLIDTIEDRNKLSHIYKEKMFNDIHSKLNTHHTALKKLTDILNAA